jgi:hypothetical protein
MRVQMPRRQHSDDKGGAGERKGVSVERKPFFPSPAAASAGPLDAAAATLVDEKSLFARDDDPLLATRVNLGNIRTTTLAQFDFHKLEFGCPSNVVCSRSRMHALVPVSLPPA